MTHDPAPREPLTPEEQALARRLAQPGLQAEPSSALDARVLAAARAAADAQERPPGHGRAPQRWPVALGLAASVALAVGIAWQLRPLPGPVAERPAAFPAGRVATRAPSPRPMSSAPPADTQATAKSVPSSETVAIPPPPPAPARIRSTGVEDMTATAEAVSEPEPPALEERALAAPMTAPLPAPPPAAPPTAQRLPEPAQTNAARKAEQASEDAAMDAAAAADQAAGDEPDIEVPPATADSPEVRDAWLQRIRELAATGQTDAARASLKEFIRRHPDAPLPDDLRALSR